MLPPKTILCATDFSPCAAHAVDCAVALASKFAAAVVIVHVMPLFDSYFVSPDMVPALVPISKAARDAATAELEKERVRMRDAAVRTQLRQGTIHEEILAAARDAGADMIVLGTHGRTGLKHVLLGSVAERVVRHSPVPVMTVPKAD
jgi:universal stress protein A